MLVGQKQPIWPNLEGEVFKDFEGKQIGFTLCKNILISFSMSPDRTNFSSSVPNRDLGGSTRSIQKKIQE
jgi:hypothetical protein